jgi:hypothetical protein
MEENPGISTTIWTKIQGPVQPYGGKSRDQSSHMKENPGINLIMWRKVQGPVQPYGEKSRDQSHQSLYFFCASIAKD